MQSISLVFSLSKLKLGLIELIIRYKFFLLFVVPFLVTLTIVGPLYAQTQLNMDDFYSQVQSSSQWWDQLWQDTFLNMDNNTADSFNQVFTIMMQIVKVISAVVLTVYIITISALIARDGLIVIPFLFRGLLVIALISHLFLGNGRNYSSIAYAGKVLFNQMSAAMLQANINGVSITNALTDRVVSAKSKVYLEREINICDAMPNPSVILPESLSSSFPLDEQNPDLNPDQLTATKRLNCYYRVKQIADDLREQAAKQQCFGIPGVNFACASTVRFLTGLGSDLEQIYSNEAERLKGGNVQSLDRMAQIGPMLRDYLLGNAAVGLFQGIMYALQQFFSSLQELILFLWALTAPVIAAFSILPTATINGLLQWGVVYVSVILCQTYYLMIVGIFASRLQASESGMAGDILFPFVLGLGAWLIAAGLASGGAIVAVRSLTNAGITAITTVGSLGAMAVGGSVGGTVIRGSAAGVSRNVGASVANSAARVPSTSRSRV